MTPLDEAKQAAGEKPAFKPLPMKGPDLDVERRADGSVVIRQRHAPAPPHRSIAHLFADRAKAHPERPYLKAREPNHGPWKTVTYGEALRAVEGIAQWLISHGLTPDDSVLILSANSIEQALLMLGCYTAGVPCSPI